MPMSMPMSAPMILYSLTTHLRWCLSCLCASSLYTFDESPIVRQLRHQDATTTCITTITTTNTVRLALSPTFHPSLHLQHILDYETHGYSAASATSNALQESKSSVAPAPAPQDSSRCRDLSRCGGSTNHPWPHKTMSAPGSSTREQPQPNCSVSTSITDMMIWRRHRSCQEAMEQLTRQAWHLKRGKLSVSKGSVGTGWMEGGDMGRCRWMYGVALL